MRITVFAAGSRGDIQPGVVLGRGLQEAGYDVRLAAPENFADFIQKHGVAAQPLHGDVQEILASDTARELMETGAFNPLGTIRAMRKLLGPVIVQMTEDALAACRGTDALVCLGVLVPFGQAIAEALGIPIVHLEPAPLLPTRAFPSPAWPIQRSLGGWHNYLSGVAMLQVLWQWYRPFVNDFRKRLGLTPYSASSLHRVLRSTPMVSAYSSSILPHAPDWPEDVHVTGYLFLDEEVDWQPSSELNAYLDAGEPPVYIGFGSMAVRDPEGLTSLVMEALAKSGLRGLVVTGWGGLREHRIPENVFVLESAPHHWLFPRMAAVVHHGGAGTTAAGLRSGVPSVIVPFAFDQFFWGSRIKALGLGPAPVPRKELTADRLAHAIRVAATDRGMRARAASFGSAIRAEEGTRNAVRVVQRYLGAP